MIKYRLESDSIGTLEVPADAYYGVQSLRGQNNFHITGYKVSDTFYKSISICKKSNIKSKL